MISVEEALARCLALCTPLGTEDVPLRQAAGRMMATPAVARRDQPPFAASAMDGYAVTGGNAAGCSYAVIGEAGAGHAFAGSLAPGQALRIFTGAPMPMGAERVVIQEDADRHGDRITVKPGADAATHIRPAGQDFRQGDALSPRRLGPNDLALLAAMNIPRVTVFRRPVVALIATGDELVMPGEVAPAAMPPGAIYNSNRFFLRSLLVRLGCVVTDMGIVPDQRAATVEALRSAALTHDVILTSGGVSVGEEDHVKPAVAELGRLDLWQIAIKPGKPFASGRIGEAHFLGLPGNPVSSFVTFLLLVRPFILSLMGVQRVAAPGMQLRADFDWPRADRRREFLRVRRNPQGGVDLFPNQSSGVLTSVVWADGIVDNPPGQTIARGDAVRFMALSDLLN